MREKPLVLLVDDEEVFLEIASVQLQSNGFETQMAHDADEAARKAEELLPDLVLSDIYMPPGPSGWELAFELHRNPKTREVRIAFFTSLRDPWAELLNSRRQLLSQLSNITFLSKTEDVDVLAQRVGELIGK
jgi:CheY-like chemotaxis protein